MCSLAVGLLAFVLRVTRPMDDTVALAASFIPYGILGSVLGLILLTIALLRARRPVVLATFSLLAAMVVGYQGAQLVPFYVANEQRAATDSFVVLSLNLYKGVADVQEVMEQVATADVVVLVEATSDAVQDLRESGLETTFPYNVGASDYQVTNTVVFSRFPLSDSEQVGSRSFVQWATTVDLPGALPDTRLLAVHPCNPFCDSTWAKDQDAVNAMARANVDRPLVMAGDFNAVDDHAPMQRLADLGLRNASDLAGSGWQPTWPADRSFPPVLPLDHILVNDQLTATSCATFAISGTDHLGLVATISPARP